MKTYTTLLTESTGPVHKITTNRPEVLNAQSRILLEELDDAFNRAVDDPEVRVIILAGAGKHFSAGHDLGSPQEMEDQKKTPLEPGFKGDTSTGASKPAKIGTGAQINVPLFINVGDVVKIDTRTGEYLERLSRA